MRPWFGSVVLATAVVLLGGCGDDGPRSPEASPATTSGATGGSPTASTSADPDAEPSVEPADGPVLRLELPQVRVPDGWKVRRSLLEGVQARAGRGREGITLFQLESIAATEFRPDQEARLIREGEPRFRRLPDVVLDGVPAIHMRAPAQAPRFVEHLVSTQYRDHSVRLRVTVRDAHADEVVASILATFEWRG